MEVKDERKNSKYSITLFKKDQITKYVVEREIAAMMGDDFSVKIVDDKKNIASKSFCVYMLPEISFWFSYYNDYRRRCS